ncbi:hypothetical protein [Candidatus Uabimicrobium sp. HlEnr_7]|uniref:hypothetical protein n=1 Tax=Candidatus Uabimicrobium helgolandensis TaxID=3095367 RepID=UPI003558A5C5
MSIHKIILCILAISSSLLFADIKLKRPRFIKKNVNKTTDIELIISEQNNRLIVISLMKPNKKQQARDANFRTVKDYENIMLGLAANLNNWGKIELRSKNILVLKNIKIVDGLTIYIGSESLVIYEKPKASNWNPKAFEDLHLQYEKKIQVLENKVANQNQRIAALEKSNTDILQVLQNIQQQMNHSPQPVYPRDITFDISYNTKPIETNHVVTATLASDPQNVRVLQTGDTIVPGLYHIDISMPGYHSLQYDLHIKEEHAPVIIKKQLQAKSRKVSFNITANNVKNFSGYQVTITPVNSKYWTAIENNEAVKPGWYFLNIKKDGYTFEKDKKIHIAPNNDPYIIKEVLSTNKRQISFNIRDKNSRAIVTAYQIINSATNTKITANDWYTINTKLKLNLKFKEYGSIDTIVVVKSGQGPYIVDIWLQNHWQKLELSTRYNEMNFDGINYPFAFYANNSKIEAHHIETRTINSYYYHRVMVPSHTKNFRVTAGYLYNQISMNEFVSGMMLGRLNGIDTSNLVAHLQQLHKNENYGSAIGALEGMLQNYRFRRKWQKVSSQEKQTLLQHLRSWRITNGQLRIRLQIVLYAMQK